LLKPFNPADLASLTRRILQEGALERRKGELRQQIAALQAELQVLEHSAEEVATSPGFSSVSGASEALDSRAPGSREGERFLKVGQLIMDLQAQRATFGEKVLDLPPAAFDYLVILARRSPHIVSYQALVTEAQHYQVVDSVARELSKWHIHMLRQAIEADPQNPQYVLNVRGEGYRLLVD
jgi:DNA-binding response OmpR family regulator